MSPAENNSTDGLTVRPAGHIFNYMVDNNPQLDDLFRALADPTRRAMLRDLAAGPRTVGELAAPFEITLAGASKHIQVLERAGLLRREVSGRVHTCRLDAGPLHTGAEWLRHYERFWNQRLDALESLLATEDAAPATPAAAPPAPRTRKSARTSKSTKTPRTP